MSKRYTVTSTQTPHGPIYQILDKVTGAVIESAYTCEKCGASYLPELGHLCSNVVEIDFHDKNEGK